MGEKAFKIAILKELIHSNAPFLKSLNIGFNVDVSFFSKRDDEDVRKNTQLTSFIFLVKDLVDHPLQRFPKALYKSLAAVSELCIYPLPSINPEEVADQKAEKELQSIPDSNIYSWLQLFEINKGLQSIYFKNKDAQEISSNKNFENWFLEFLNSIKQNRSQLLRLGMQGIDLKKLGINQVLNHLGYTSLTTLALDKCGFGAIDGLQIAGFFKSKSTTLFNISLANNNIGEKAAAEIILSLAKNSEVSLDLSYTELDDVGPIALALQENNKFKYLNFSGNSLKRNAELLFNALLQCHDLEGLHISNLGSDILIGSVSLNAAVNQLFKEHKGLRDVSFSRNEIPHDSELSDAILSGILAGNSLIETLDISKSNCFSSMIESLIEENKHLEIT